MDRTTETALPGWEQMSELDRGAALLHMWKRSWEGASYAVDNYPCRYIESPALLGLDLRQACAHAVEVCGSDERMRKLLGDEEYQRLYDHALNEGDRVLADRKLWAVRFPNGNISPCETREQAEFMVLNLSWRGEQLLRRSEAGGPWSVDFDASDLEQDACLHHVQIGDQVLREQQWTAVTATGSYRRTVGDVAAGLPTRWLELADGTRLELPSSTVAPPEQHQGRVRRATRTPS